MHFTFILENIPIFWVSCQGRNIGDLKKTYLIIKKGNFHCGKIVGDFQNDKNFLHSGGSGGGMMAGWEFIRATI